MVRLLAVRHGQTDWNAAGRLQGSTDVELNPAAAIGCNVEIMEEFAERGVGIYEGLTPEEAKERYPAQWAMGLTRHVHRGPPGGESILDVALRVAAGLRRIRSAHEGRTVLLIAHGYVCRAMYGILARPTDQEFFAFRMDNGQIADYRVEGEGGAFLGFL